MVVLVVLNLITASCNLDGKDEVSYEIYGCDQLFVDEIFQPLCQPAGGLGRAQL